MLFLQKLTKPLLTRRHSAAQSSAIVVFIVVCFCSFSRQKYKVSSFPGTVFFFLFLLAKYQQQTPRRPSDESRAHCAGRLYTLVPCRGTSSDLPGGASPPNANNPGQDRYHSRKGPSALFALPPKEEP